MMRFCGAEPGLICQIYSTLFELLLIFRLVFEYSFWPDHRIFSLTFEYFLETCFWSLPREVDAYSFRFIQYFLPAEYFLEIFSETKYSLVSASRGWFSGIANSWPPPEIWPYSSIFNFCINFIGIFFALWIFSWSIFNNKIFSGLCQGRLIQWDCKFMASSRNVTL